MLHPLQVQIFTIADDGTQGPALPNVSVTFQVASSAAPGGLVANPYLNTNTAPAPALTLTVLTDPITAVATAYYWQPTTANATNQISATSGAGSATFTTTTTASKATAAIYVSPPAAIPTTAQRQARRSAP
jgi:hypothetical protein